MKPAVSLKNNREIILQKMHHYHPQNPMNKKLIAGLALATVASVGAVSGVNAYRGDYTKQGPNYSPERHTTMEKAFETNDYNLWKSQMGDRGVTRVINESNFDKFAEAYRLAKEGKTDEADQIRAELKLRTKNGEAQGLRRGNGEGGRMGGGMHYNQK